MRAALAQAEACGLNTGLVREAQRRLDTLKRVAELEAALQDCRSETRRLWQQCATERREALLQRERIAEAIEAAYRGAATGTRISLDA